MSALSKDRIDDFGRCLSSVIKQREAKEKVTSCVFEDTVLLQCFGEDVCPPVLRPHFGTHEPFVLASLCPSNEMRCPDNEEEMDEDPLYPIPLKTTQVVVCGTISQDLFPELQGARHNSSSAPIHIQEINDRCLTRLSVDNARRLLSLYSAACQQERGHLRWPALWVACQGEGVTEVKYFACREKVSSSPLRGIAEMDTLTVRSCGSVLRPTSVLNSPPAMRPLPAMMRMTSRSFSRLASNEDVEENEMDCFAEYDIIGSQSFETTFDSSQAEIDSSVSSLQVRFAWNRAISLLTTPPSTSRCAILIRVVPGDLRSPAAQLANEWRQIEHWLALCNAEEDARRSWRSPGVGTPAVARTEHFLEEVETRRPEDLMQWRPEQPQAELEAISAELLTQRKDLDFTELVWLLVKDAHSAADAVECLMSILKALLHERVQPMVYRDNMTLLAQLIRRRLQCTDAEQFSELAKELSQKYTAEDLLEVCVQIGLYKLERDYIHFFLSEKLVTWEQLKPFLSSSNDGVLDYDERLKWLQRLQACLELALTCRTFVRVPHDSLRELLRSALAYHANAPSSHSPTFCLPLSSAHTCLQSCQSNLPITWFASARQEHSITAVLMVADDDLMDESGKLMDMVRFSISQISVSS